ncbi:hypothetical protein TNCV_4557431 [Trichonephila clavipes]|nr:hypothetical protein TNCV_4557431 [Trichonephila clavipes]
MSTWCFILNGTKRILQCDGRNGFIQPKQIYSATTIIQVLFGNREKLSNDELAARGAVKQNVFHSGESVLRFRICQNLLGNCCAKTFSHEISCKEPPHRHNISRWVKQLQDTGCSCKNKSPGRKETKPEVVERICDSFLRSPPKST